MRPKVRIEKDKIAQFCRRWKIREFALFGSILRDDFRPDSDVDVLVTFTADAGWSYWEFPDMQDELEGMFGRRVELLEKETLRNPYRRHQILNNLEVVYAA